MNQIARPHGEWDRRDIVKIERDRLRFPRKRDEMLRLVKTRGVVAPENIREKLRRVTRSASKVNNQLRRLGDRIEKEGSCRVRKHLGNNLEPSRSYITITEKILHHERSGPDTSRPSYERGLGSTPFLSNSY